jgi:LPS export ABC transporter protein LptC
VSHEPILLLSSLLLLLGCEGKEEKSIPTREPFAQEIVEELTLRERHKGETVWILTAEKAINYEAEGVVKVYSLELRFFDEEEVSSVLTADSGAVFTSSNDMQAMGQVRVVNRQDATLRTDMLEWDNERRLITTEEAIEIETEESVITGIGLESDPDLKHLKVKEGFRARKIGE